jgi:hypothetical protein
LQRLCDGRRHDSYDHRADRHRQAPHKPSYVRLGHVVAVASRCDCDNTPPQLVPKVPGED